MGVASLGESRGMSENIKTYKLGNSNSCVFKLFPLLEEMHGCSNTLIQYGLALWTVFEFGPETEILGPCICVFSSWHGCYLVTYLFSLTPDDFPLRNLLDRGFNIARFSCKCFPKY